MKQRSQDGVPPRIYNKLKARKQRGSISTDQWNRQVAAVQRLKDEFAEGRIDKEEYVQRLDALRRKKRSVTWRFSRISTPYDEKPYISRLYIFNIQNGISVY